MTVFNLAAYENKFIPQSGNTYIENDLDGSGVRRFLEARGYEVVSNCDTGRNGQAITKCGFVVSTNGYVHRNVKA